VAALEISFPEASLGESARLVQSLRTAAIRAGVPAEEVVLQKSDRETMNLAEFLSMIPSWIEGAKPLIDMAAIALAVYEIGFREKCVMKIKTPKGEIQIGPGTMTVQQLKTVLSESLRGNPKS
jgi:hypothetical protein